MAKSALEALKSLHAEADFIDLQELRLPICDGDTAYSDPVVEQVQARLAKAEGILISGPVYNYDLNAALKNLVELTGSAWEDKVVGFLNSAGGFSSYMSVMSFANSLMLDFRCVIIPRFVYATSQAFAGEEITDRKVAVRIAELAGEMVRFVTSLRGPV
jgi:FMN reductase